MVKRTAGALFIIVLAWSQNTKAQAAELSTKEIMKLLPDKIKGFYPSNEFLSKQIRIGTLTYTLCEKKFESGRKSIKLLLFDYANAGIMYKQATRTWKVVQPLETDSLVMRALEMNDCNGWETYRKSTGQSQIFVGICNRFFLSMTGEHIDLDILKSILTQIPLENFPK